MIHMEHPEFDDTKEDDEFAADRHALETIRGEQSETSWPDDALAPGTRVTVIKDANWNGPWAQVFAGEITTLQYPELVIRKPAFEGEYKYFVKFDESQMDAGGDGPYRMAQISARYLQAVAESAVEPEIVAVEASQG